MTPDVPPLRRMFDLGDLSQAGADVVVEAQTDELPRLAEWAGVNAVRSFRATVTLSRMSTTRFNFDAELSAEIVQTCVVTLEPIETAMSRHVSRELHYLPEAGKEGPAPSEDDVPETIASLHYDLAYPLLEEFALAIDPYPRKEGVRFEPPEGDQGAPEGPFAVLKGLKDRG